MRFPWQKRAPKAKLPPVERSRRKVYRWKWIQVGVIAVNLIIMGALAGFLTARNIRMAAGMVVPLIMAGVAFLVTGVMNWSGRYVHGYRHRWFTLLVILADMLCIGTQVAAFVTLTLARLPTDCTGLTPISSHPDDPQNTPEPGYDNIAFGQPDENGQLDSYCNAPRVSWVISVLLIISYFHTTGWAIRLIVALKNNNMQKCEVAEPEMESSRRNSRPPAPAPSLPRHHISIPVGPLHDGAPYIPHTGGVSSAPRPELGGAPRSELDVPPSEWGGPRSELAGDDIEPVSPVTGGDMSRTGSPPPYQDRVSGALLGDRKQRFGNNR